MQAPLPPTQVVIRSTSVATHQARSPGHHRLGLCPQRALLHRHPCRLRRRTRRRQRLPRGRGHCLRDRCQPQLTEALPHRAEALISSAGERQRHPAQVRLPDRDHFPFAGTTGDVGGWAQPYPWDLGATPPIRRSSGPPIASRTSCATSIRTTPVSMATRQPSTRSSSTPNSTSSPLTRRRTSPTTGDLDSPACARTSGRTAVRTTPRQTALSLPDGRAARRPRPQPLSSACTCGPLAHAAVLVGHSSGHAPSTNVLASINPRRGRHGATPR